MIEIIFEDEQIIVANKPSGIATQQTQSQENTLESLIGKEVYAAHRLDQRASGLIILAKNKKTLAQLQQDFADRKIIKKYKAAVANKPPKVEDTLVHWILKSGKNQKAKAFDKEVAHSKKAELHYRILQSSLRYYLLEIELFTGRFHQIRSQLAAINASIVGDVKYGYKRTTNDGSIFLQSYFLQFNHPQTNENLQFELPLKESWKKYGFE